MKILLPFIIVKFVVSLFQPEIEAPPLHKAAKLALLSLASPFPSCSPTKSRSTKAPNLPKTKPPSQLSRIPSNSPTNSLLPTSTSPSLLPTVSATSIPSFRPTKSPSTKAPNLPKTKPPSQLPRVPSLLPTSTSPSLLPTTSIPSFSPTKFPSTKAPNLPKTKPPSQLPSIGSANFFASPTRSPSKSSKPTKIKTIAPSRQPSMVPSYVSPDQDITYHYNGLVLLSPKIYNIYVGSFSTTTMNLIDYLAANVDQGTPSWYSVVKSYPQIVNHLVSYVGAPTFIERWTFLPSTTTLNDDFLQSLIGPKIASKGLLNCTDCIFAIIFRGEFKMDGWNDRQSGLDQFCGYHKTYGYTDKRGESYVANIAVIGDPMTTRPTPHLDCISYTYGATANNDPSADSIATTYMHEIAEVITDPDGNTWFNDITNYEIADPCIFNFGDSFNYETANYNYQFEFQATSGRREDPPLDQSRSAHIRLLPIDHLLRLRSVHCGQSLLPLDGTTMDLFQKSNNGLLLCRLIGATRVDAIDDKLLNTKPGMNVYQKTENQNLALRAAKKIGCQVVNIGAQDLIEGRPVLVLGLLWQIIRLQLMGLIHMKNIPELEVLRQEGEDKTAFMSLTPEVILIRWLNYHLKKAGSNRVASNFSSDLADSEIYGVVLNRLNPTVCSPITETDPLERAAHAISNAKALGAPIFIKPKDISDANKKLNSTFVAQIFNTCHGLTLEESAPKEPAMSESKKQRRSFVDNADAVTTIIRARCVGGTQPDSKAAAAGAGADKKGAAQKTASKVPPKPPANNCLTIMGNTLTLKNPSKSLYSGTSNDKSQIKEYLFDDAFDNCPTEEVYQRIRGDVLQVVDGYNTAVISFGAVESGKTYSIFGSNSPSTTASPGLVSKSVRDIFKLIDERHDDRNVDFNKGEDVCIRVSFIELYGNSFRNLIKPVSTDSDAPAGAYSASFSAQDDDNVSVVSDASGLNFADTSKLAIASSSGVDLHDHPSTGIFFVSETVLRYEVKSPEELLHFVSRGLKKRACSVLYSEQKKEFSSSSHAILTVYAETKYRYQKPFEDEQQCELRMGKIHFVDLAGSERMENELFNKQRAVKGKTVFPGRSGPPITKELMETEMHDINKSLQSLTLVITSLVKNASTPKSKPVHVNYMESKLPHCLKDCLGGNSKTFFLYTVRSEVSEYRQTLHTLNLAKDMQGVCNHRHLNAFPLGNRAFRLNALGKKSAVDSGDDVLNIPSFYASNLIAAVQSEEEKFKDDLKRELTKAKLLLDDGSDDDEVVAPATDVVQAEEEEAVVPTSVEEAPPVLSEELSLSEEVLASEEFIMETAPSDEEVNICNEIETQTDPDPDNLQEYVQILLADKTAKEKEIELLKQQVDDMRKLFDGAKEKLENIVSNATISNSTPLDNSSGGGVTFSIANTNLKSAEVSKDDSLISANIHVSDLGFSNALSFSDGSDSSARLDEGNLLRISDAVHANSAQIYSTVISPVVQLVNLKIEILEQLMNDFYLLSTGVERAAQKSNLNVIKNVSNVTDYDEQSVVCFQSAHASEIILAVNTELSALRKTNRSLTEANLALKTAEERNLKTIADLRDLLSSETVREPGQDQMEEIKALRLKEEANAKIIAELEALLAAYREPPVHDNNGTLIFANIRFSCSKRPLSTSSSDSYDNKVNDVAQSKLLSVARFSTADDTAATNRDGSAFTSIVQYPVALLDYEKKSPGMLQSPSRLADAKSTDVLSISDGNKSRVVNLLAMPESELLTVIDEVNQQLHDSEKLAAAQKAYCEALTAELKALEAANQKNLADTKSQIEHLCSELETEYVDNSKRELLIQQLQEELQQLKYAAAAQGAQKSVDEVRVFNNGSEFRVENASAATSFFFCDFDTSYAKLESSGDATEGDLMKLKKRSNACSSSINYKEGLSVSDELMLESVLSNKDLQWQASGGDVYLAISRPDMLSFIEECKNQLQLARKSSEDKSNQLADMKPKIEKLCSELENEYVANSKRELLIQQLQEEIQQLKYAAAAQAAQKSVDEVRVFNNGSEFRVENASAATSFFFCDFDTNYAKLESSDEATDGDLMKLKKRSNACSSTINYKEGLSVSDDLMLESVLSTKDLQCQASGGDVYLAISRPDMLSFIKECQNQLQLARAAIKKLEEEAKSASKLLEAESNLTASLSAALSNAVDIASIDEFGVKLSPITEVGNNQFGAAALPLANMTFKKLTFQSNSNNNESSSTVEVSKDAPKQISALNEVCGIVNAHKTVAGGATRRRSKIGNEETAFYCFQEKSFLSIMEVVNRYLLELDSKTRLYEEEKRKNLALGAELESLEFELSAVKACAEQYLLELKAKSMLLAKCDDELKEVKIESELLRDKIQALNNELTEYKSSLFEAVAEINRQKASAIDVDNSGATFKVSNSTESVSFSFQQVSFHDSLLALSSSDSRPSNFFQLSDSLGPFPTIQSQRKGSSTTSAAADAKVEASDLKFIALNEKDLNDSVNRIVVKWLELISAKDRYINGITAQSEAKSAAAAKVESELTQKLILFSDKLDHANGQIDLLNSANTKLSRDSAIQIKDLMEKLALSQTQCDSVLQEVKKLNTRLNKLKDKFSISKLMLEPVSDGNSRTDGDIAASISTGSSASFYRSQKASATRRTSDVDGLQYEVLTLSPIIDERILSNDESVLVKYCAIEESELVAIMQAINKRLRDSVSLHSNDLTKVMSKTKNVEDLKCEIKKLQHTLNEVLHQNELLRSVKVENIGSALSVLSSREDITFSFYHLVRDGARSPGEVKTGLFKSANTSAIAYALEKMNGPVTSICYVTDDRSVMPSNSISSSYSSEVVGKQPGIAVSSEPSYTTPSHNMYKKGLLKGRSSFNGSTNNLMAFPQEEKLMMSFAAIDKSEISRFLDSVNRILHEYDAALAEKSYEVLMLSKDNNALLNQVTELQDAVQEHKYRHAELQDLVTSYIRDIDALHKYSKDRFAEVKSANHRVNEVLAMLKQKSEENDALMVQVEYFKRVTSSTMASNTITVEIHPQEHQNRMQQQLEQQEWELQQQLIQQQQQLMEQQQAHSRHQLYVDNGGGHAHHHQQSPPSVVTTSPAETVRMFGKIDPDDEALEHGILLSKQLERYGLTMYDAIKPVDEGNIAAYMSEGYAREEAVLLLFEERYGPVDTTSSLGLLSIPTVNFSTNGV
eukprot:gene24055-32465_t